MSRTFVYARVSKEEQTTDNQLLEIEAAGFSVQPRRIVVEQISGGVAAAARPGFSKLLDRLEQGDILIVTKLDRLGRNAMDIRSTVERLAKEGVRIYCLALGGMDLNSSTGKLAMGMIAAFAEFERDQLIERTNAGLARTVAQGTKLGRREALSAKQQSEVRDLLAAGTAVAEIARNYSTSRQTIMRIRQKVGSE